MLKLLLLFSFLNSVECACHEGFELVRDGQCRGFYTHLNVPDDEMAVALVEKCEEIQATPVIIHDDVDNSYWVQQQYTQGGYYMPLGILCNVSSLKWEWADGSTLDYKPPTYSSELDSACETGSVWVIQRPGKWQYGSLHTTYDNNIFCMQQLQQPTLSGEGCDNFDIDDGVCYQVGQSSETWQDAQITCKSFGAEVASIHNAKENLFVRRLAVSNGAVNGLYLGASLSGKGNNYGWIDGSEWDYDNFYPGFPMNGLGDCLAMETQDVSGEWVNVDCSSKLSVACVRQPTLFPCSCGPWKEGQIIASPGFPYDASTPCEYILIAGAGKKVELEILMLEANTCCDHLVIFDNYIGGKEIANLSGEVSNKTYSTSSSNSMRVSWQPNGGVNVRGVMMRFRGV